MASKLRSGGGLRVSFFAFQDIITSVTGILILVTLILTLYLNNAPLAVETRFTQATPRDRERLERELAQTDGETRLLQRVAQEAGAAPEATALRAQIAELQPALARAQAEVERWRQQGGKSSEAERRRRSEMGEEDLLRRLRETQSAVNVQRQVNDAVRREVDQAREKVQEVRTNLVHVRASGLFVIPTPDSTGKEPIFVVVETNKITSQRFNRPDSVRVLAGADVAGQFAAALSGYNPQRDYFVFYLRPSGVPLFHVLQPTARGAGFTVGYDALEENTPVSFTSPLPP